MKILLIYLPFAVSYFIGYFLTRLVLRKNHDLPSALVWVFAGGLGLGISAALTFSSFLVFDQFHRTYVIALNLGVLIILAAGFVIQIIKSKARGQRPKALDQNSGLWPNASPARHGIDHCVPGRAGLIQQLMIIIGIIFLSIPLWFIGHFRAFGGWDAWSTWNLKAKFLFLGGGLWKNLFDPVLWRASPHYPLLQPLMNVWGWSWVNEPNLLVPIFTSYYFTILTLIGLTSGLYYLTRSRLSFLPAIVLLTSTYYVKTALSQYCDIVIGYYIFVAFFCLIAAKKLKNLPLLAVAGVSLGLLSFAKSEGTIALGAVLGLGIIYLYPAWKNNQPWKPMALFAGATLLSMVPTVIFLALYAPENQTFINGLSSPIEPARISRLIYILSFYAIEFINENWQGLLMVLLISSVVCVKHILNKATWIIPLFIVLYIGVITAYYYVNTYFAIDWWLQVSYNRIIFSLLPVIFLWLVYSLCQLEGNKKPGE